MRQWRQMRRMRLIFLMVSFSVTCPTEKSPKYSGKPKSVPFLNTFPKRNRYAPWSDKNCHLLDRRPQWASLLRITPDGQVTSILKSERPWSPTGVAVRGEDLCPRIHQRKWPPYGRLVPAGPETCNGRCVHNAGDRSSRRLSACSLVSYLRGFQVTPLGVLRTLTGWRARMAGE